MKKHYIVAFAFLTCLTSFSQTDLIITGVFDGPLTGGSPKVIELYAINDIPALTRYAVGSANNGDGSDGPELELLGSASAGEFIYISSSAFDFLAYFNFAANFTSDVASINGDDAIELFYDETSFFEGAESVVDIFGDINTDGTNQDWEYLDGWAYRNNDSSPNTNFALSEWSFSGINAVDNCTSNESCNSTFPIATFMRSTLFTNDNNIASFTIYPNPVSEEFISIVGNFNTKLNIKIFDIIGKQVLSKQISNNKLNISTLKSGVYILEVSQNNTTSTKKIVVQ